VAARVGACGFNIDNSKAFHGVANISVSATNLRGRSAKDLRSMKIAVDLGHEGNIYASDRHARPARPARHSVVHDFVW